MRLLRTLSVICLAVALLLAGLTWWSVRVDVVHGRRDSSMHRSAVSERCRTVTLPIGYTPWFQH